MPHPSSTLAAEGNVEVMSIRLTSITNLLHTTYRVLMLLAGFSLAALMCAQVIMRYFLDSPFAGIEEIAILLGVWVYFLGMGYASLTREHIQGGIVSLLVKDPWKLKLLELAALVVSLVAALIFGYFACKYALFVIEKGRNSIYLRWPKGFWSASMIVGFSMMAICFLAQAVQTFHELRVLGRNARKGGVL
ncbi:TRAP-type C4-dicarboxylate transport system permease small subunit [Marinobacterium halophilum]|uniref:TRAP transporter small permease protein n=1 Tax=Marinobacterium halophilum TaxID=267374 RepID=A0A2P8EZQ7_9GAMM|nr:TRAP transporter small permease subunit [Marinobacterium halophilum]PSL14954.1 TRAP-type C4-dicarboxylate transport system permease small subunit [Marinobacterium halophilum]